MLSAAAVVRRGVVPTTSLHSIAQCAGACDTKEHGRERGAAAQSAEDGSYALTGTRTAQIRQLQLWKGACRRGCRRLLPQAPRASLCVSSLRSALRSIHATLPLHAHHAPSLLISLPPPRARRTAGPRASVPADASSRLISAATPALRADGILPHPAPPWIHARRTNA